MATCASNTADSSVRSTDLYRAGRRADGDQHARGDPRIGVAATFALTNAFLRRGVLTGSVVQAMAITVPLGGLMFLLLALAGGLFLLPMVGQFSIAAIGLLAISGIIHFVLGRYCNFRAVKAMGAVLSGPVIEASLVWAICLAIYCSWVKH
jgi:drug/metabolite transporter (DMT)-like permease